MHKIRIIKKYNNKKLYDTYAHKYVTLEDLEKIIKNGEDFKIIENQTQIDVTLKFKLYMIYNKELNRELTTCEQKK